MKKICSLFVMLAAYTTNIYAQGHCDSLSQWPTFALKTTITGNLYFGLKKSNNHNKNILRTPPYIGPEVSFTPGIRINKYASVYAGASLAFMPIYYRFSIDGGPYYAPDYDLRESDYFIALSIIGIPISYEHIFYLPKKNRITAEAGLSINYNMTYSYGSIGIATIGDYPPYFYIEIHDNNEIKWFPSGFFKVAYMRSFTPNSALNVGLRLNYSAVSLGKGYYKFDGFEGDDFFNGNLDVPFNSLALDVTYHFSHSRYRKRNL